MRTLKVFLMGMLLISLGCKKKDAPKPPGAAKLVYPEINSECTTGVSINELTSNVEFKWAAADNTETYVLRVTSLNTNIVQTISTQGLSAKLPLLKGVPFSWLVNTKNSQVNQTVASETWRFYNAGSRTTHPPFPTEIISPKLSESVFKDINNEVELDWNGADVDNDLVGYDVYFSVENPPQALVSSENSTTTVRKVSVLPNTTYYWKVISKDSEGNTSDSGIFSFKVL